MDLELKNSHLDLGQRIMLVAIKVYHSLLKLKQKAHVILPLYDPDVLEMKSIP